MSNSTTNISSVSAGGGWAGIASAARSAFWWLVTAICAALFVLFWLVWFDVVKV